MNAVIDRFGKNITLCPDGEEWFKIRVNVKAEMPFFGWLFQFGTKAEIVQPKELKEKYIEQLKEELAYAQKENNL